MHITCHALISDLILLLSFTHMEYNTDKPPEDLQVVEARYGLDDELPGVQVDLVAVALEELVPTTRPLAAKAKHGHGLVVGEP